MRTRGLAQVALAVAVAAVGLVAGHPSEAVAVATVAPAQTATRVLVDATIGTGMASAQDQATPVDVSIAVGRGLLLAAMNRNLEVESIARQDTITAFDLDTLFGVGSGSQVGEPQIMYDAGTARFFLVASEQQRDGAGVLTGSRVLVAWSSDASSWQHRALTPLSTTEDYRQPLLAVGGSTVVVATTDTPSAGGASTGSIHVIDKNALVSSGTVSQTTVGSVAALAPASTTGTTTWLVSSGSDAVTTVAVTGSPADRNVATTTHTMAVPPFTAPPALAQPGATVAVPSPRLYAAAWHAGTLWTVQVDGCAPAGDTATRSCLRLLGLAATSASAAPTVSHDVEIGDRGFDYYAPGLTVDGLANLAVTATVSNTTQNPSPAMFVLRSPYSHVDGYLLDDVGGGPYPGQNWGGYSSAATDPSDPAHVWVDGPAQMVQGSAPSRPETSTVAIGLYPATPPACMCAPGIAGMYNGLRELIYRRTNGHLVWLSYDPFGGGWRTALPLAGKPAGGVAMTSSGSFQTAYVRWTDNTIRSIQGDESASGWGTWTNLGGAATSDPAVALNERTSTPRLDVFTRGRDRHVFLKRRDGSAWSAWTSLGGTLTSAPGAAWTSSTAITVIGRSIDGHLHYRTSTTAGKSWGRWHDLGGQPASAPVAISPSPGTLDVFVRWANNHLYTRRHTSHGWTAWTDLGGAVRSTPGASITQTQSTTGATINTGELVVTVGPGNSLHQRYRPIGGAWQSWQALY